MQRYKWYIHVTTVILYHCQKKTNLLRRIRWGPGLRSLIRQQESNSVHNIMHLFWFITSMCVLLDSLQADLLLLFSGTCNQTSIKHCFTRALWELVNILYALNIRSTVLNSTAKYGRTISGLHLWYLFIFFTYLCIFLASYML